MLVLMTKVGVYAVLRVWLAVFGEGAGAAEGFGFAALTLGGMATVLFGAIGMLASQDGGRMAGYGAIVSSGTLLAVIGHSGGAVLASGLYYLLGSTLAMAAFMLLIELTERIRPPGAALIAITMEAFAIEDKPEDPVGVGIPGTLAFLGLSFAACALVIAGMPPLSGFVAKFSLFHALLAAAPEGAPATTWMLIGLMILGGLAAIIALMRLGVRIFWAAGAVTPPRLQFSEAAPVGALVLLCVLLTVQAGTVFDYLGRTTAGLLRSGDYAARVLGEPPVLRAPGAEEGAR
jgi:multicomponent K+:H+ antiporter subunit D